VYYGYVKQYTITTEEHTMNTLSVYEVKAGTETDGFDISYRVKVVAPGTEHDETEIYSSRFADKAVMKAVVKTAEAPFLGFTVSVDPDVASAAGVRNLEQRVNSERFLAAKEMFAAEFDAKQAVEFIKQVQG
jgi:hypothetical protein